MSDSRTENLTSLTSRATMETHLYTLYTEPFHAPVKKKNRLNCSQRFFFAFLSFSLGPLSFEIQDGEEQRHRILHLNADEVKASSPLRQSDSGLFCT